MFSDLYASFIKCFSGENFLFPKLGGHKIIYNSVMTGKFKKRILIFVIYY